MSCICRTCLSEITSNHVDINQSELARKQLTLCIPELNLDLVIQPILCMKCVEALNAAYDFKSCCLQTEQRIYAHMETLTIEQQNVELVAVLGNNHNGSNSMAMHCGDDIINDLNIIQEHSRTRHHLEDYNDAKSENCSEMSFDDGVEVNYDNLKEERIEIEEHELDLQDCSSSQKHDVDSKEQLKGLLQQYNKLDPVNYNANGENRNSPTISAESFTKQGNNVTKSQVGVMSMERNNSSASGTFSVAVMKGMETQVKKDSHLKCDMNIKSNNTAAAEAEADVNSVIDCSPLQPKHSNTSALNNSNTFTNVSLQCFINSNNLSVQVKNEELSISPQFLNTIGKKPYNCDQCDYACSRKGNLIKHMGNHTGEKPYKCNVCNNYASSQKSHLNSHLRTHTGEKPYKCDVCDYAYSHKNNLIKHIKKHTGEKPYKCDQCDYACSDKSSLIVHMRIHTGQKPYKCNVCNNYAGSTKSHLNSHLMTHTGQKPYKCTVCNYASSHRSSLNNHLRTHTGEKPYKCDQCDYACSRKSHLIMHIMNHTGKKPYKCNVCNYASSQKSGLNIHLRTHNGEKPYKCNVCNYASSNKYSLNKHLRAHTGEKPYKCNVCNYTSSNKGNLIKHMRKHTGEKPYKCNICNYASSQKSNLNNHLMTHTGEKSYKCDQCDYACSRKDGLIIHIRNHTGEKPYKCNVCNYASSQKASLNVHLRTHTRKKTI